MVITYRYFFATGPVTSSWNLEDTAEHVFYDGRVKKSPGYKHKIGVDQQLTSLVGSGTLVLNNNDGGFDDLFDTVFFENQRVSVYSWSRQLAFSDAKIIFKGRITNKTYSNESISFTVKDTIFDLEQSVPQGVFDDDDDVTESVKGNYKRWLYGRMDGMRLQSVDQIGDGYAIAGTLTTATPAVEQYRFENPTLNGTTIQGKYFFISSTTTDYYYYYDTDPVIGGRTGVNINVNLGDSIDEVFEKTATKLAGNFVVFKLAIDNFLVGNEEFGNVTDASNVNAGITISKLNDGQSDKVIFGSGTSFLSDLSPNDILTVGTQEFTISSINSDTELIISDSPTFTFTGLTATVNPEIPTTVKNRTFFVTDHAGAKLTKTLTSITQFNRVVLSDLDGLQVGDFIEFDTAERIQIKSFAPNNTVVLQQNVITLPTVSSDVVRQPVQSIFVKSTRIKVDNFTLTNLTTALTITLDSDVEFDIARVEALVPTFTFTNGSRTVTSSTGEDLTNLIRSRDFIKPSGVTFTTFYEVLSVTETTVTLRIAFADATDTDTGSIKRPDYIGDTTIVSADVLGRTVDGTVDGTWISTAPQAITHLLGQIGITELNTASFTSGAIDSPQIISLPIPFTPGGELTSVKTVVDALNNSTRSSVTIDNDLDIKYTTLLTKIDDDIATLTDKEIVKWSVRSTNGNIYRNAVVRYKHTDVNRFTLEAGNSVVTYTSLFVQKYIGTDKSNEIDVRFYNAQEAQTRAHREVYYSRLSRTEIIVESDLRLDTFEIGDNVKLDFRRLYKRFGNSNDRDKVVTVIGKTIDGDKVSLTLSDVGNVYNSSSIITPNTAVDFASATDAEKIKRGFITDAQGIVEDQDDTANTHLIS